MGRLKKCNECGIEKPLSEYHKYCGSKDGYNTRCKRCRYLAEKKRLGWKDKEVFIKEVKVKAKEFPNGTKLCSNCGEVKPLSDFVAYKKGKYVTRVASCKQCNDFYARSKKYRITKEEYITMIKSQDYKCKICGEKKALVIDHCHKSDRVRGLLCDNCNMAIGLMKENIKSLQSAIKYLLETNYTQAMLDKDTESLN